MNQLFPVTFNHKNSIKPLSLAVATAFLAACSSAPTTTIGQPTTKTVTRTATPNSNSTVTVQANAGLLDEGSLDELEGLLEATDMSMVENNALVVQQYGNLWDRLRKGFRMNGNQYNARIEAQKSWFISRQDYLNRLTARASRYFYHTVREAERRNIPTELALLPVIESSYDPLANSNAAAVGLWQFIPSTGRIYGLNQTATFDGRRDVIESTRAAYDFLTALYNQFGSWELALAAYNSGPGRVQSAIDYNAARGLPTDYWSLRLPTETMNYVPRFLAVAQIVKDPNSYNVYLPAIANRQHFRSVPANVGVSLSEVSSLTGVGYDELRALNPGLLAGAVDMSGPNRILIPNEVATSFDKKITALRGNGFSSNPAYNAASYPTPTTTYSSPNYNAPSSGDNFAAAQQAFGKSNTSLPTSGSELANLANSMVKNQTTTYVAPATIPVASHSEPPLTAAEQKQIAAQMAIENTLPTTSAQITANNTVVQEPPLSSTEKQIIAQQIEQTSPQVAQVVNPADGNIKLNAIQTQQSILDAKGETKQLSYEGGVVSDGGMGVPTLPKSQASTQISTPTPSQTKPQTQSSPKPRPTGERSTYQVKRGDTLKSIATQMGVEWRDIAEWNQIDPNKNLLAGATLYLYNAKPITAPATTKPMVVEKTKDNYVVQSGDTLLGIANKFDLSLSELASYNNIPTTYQVRTKQTLWLIPNKIKPVATPKTAPAVVKPVAIVPKYATSNYKVKAGDGLIALADSYDISTSELAAINGISPTDNLLVGQVIKVPQKATAKPVAAQTDVATPKEPANYVVKSGETLSAIAQRNNISLAELAKLNALTVTTNVKTGQKLYVPKQEVTAKAEPPKHAKPSEIGKTTLKKPEVKFPEKSVTKTEKPKTISYTVKNGDSLTALAKRYNLTNKQLADSNGLPSNVGLKIGQTIQVPAK